MIDAEYRLQVFFTKKDAYPFNDILSTLEIIENKTPLMFNLYKSYEHHGKKEWNRYMLFISDIIAN